MNNSFLFAQVKDSLLIGEVKGTVADAAYNFKLRAATLAIYMEKDSSIVEYQLSNGIGAFRFLKLPVNVPLYLVASYVGYEKKGISFIIPESEPKLDLKTIALRRDKGEQLQEVIVTYIPPVRMNGDTLEFNADAFKLDQSAVIEDLLRRLPGVTVWSDGAITVNGKEVSGVKVDGKPFLTGDPKVAIQNLPKDIVDKIQVYQKYQNNPSRSDSVSEVNIKLKSGKNFGGFGKVGTGTNFSNRNESEISFNLFNPRSQAGFVWAKNNVNKTPKDVNTILRNTTYKGISNSLEYSPDFELPGINRSHSGGLIFQHDFISDPSVYKNNRINGGYFLQDLQSDLKEHSKTLLGIDNASSLEQLDTVKENVRRINHSLYTHYNLKRKGKVLNLYASVKRSVNDRDVNQISNTYNNEGDLLNKNFIANESRERSNESALRIGGEHELWARKRNRFPKMLTYSYSIDYGDWAYQGTKHSDFAALLDGGEDSRFYNRSYNNRSTGLNQTLGSTIGSLSPLLFGNGKLSSIDMTFINDLKVFNSNENNKVADRDSTLTLYKQNTYLSNNANYLAITETPGMRFRKAFSMSLANRYFKTLTMLFLLKGSFFSQRNNSNHAFQVFHKNYSDFIPSATVSFDNYQLGRHHNVYTMNYSRTVSYPEPVQLVPLVDSSNGNFIVLGNLGLKPYKKDDISFDISHETFATNVFNYRVNASIGKISGAWGDYTTIDQSGRRELYVVNLDGYRYLLAGGELKKSFDLTNTQWQFSLNGQLNLRNSPNIINDKENITHITTESAELGVHYSFKELLAFELKQSYFNYASKQRNVLTPAFQSVFRTTSLAGTIQFTKKMRLCTDIQYKSNSTSFSAPINYTIWNAHIILRMLKSNSLECKFSAMDILGQNNVLNNFGDNNLITQRISNSLQQYYMVTLAFYPRKFGRADRKVSEK